MGDCDGAISKIIDFEDGDQAGEALKSVVLGLSRRDKNYWDKVSMEIKNLSSLAELMLNNTMIRLRSRSTTG